MRERIMFGRFLEDFTEGQTLLHEPSVTITEDMNRRFCELTQNHHPLHNDKEYAKDTEYGNIVVCGLLTMSLAVGLSVADVSGLAIAALGYSECEHIKPVFIGDTLSAESTVLLVRPSKQKPDRGVVEVQTIVRNQAKDMVFGMKRKVLVPRRSCL